MKKLAKVVLTAAGMVLNGLPAHAAFVIQGGADQNLPIAGNNFNNQITTLGFDRMAAGAQLRVSEDGYIDFYYTAAESAYNNSFTATGNGLDGNNSGFLTEHNEAFDFAGYAGFTIAVSADDIVNFSFTSDNRDALKPVDNYTGTNLHGLGILFDSSQSGALQQVLLGYDDQLYNDDNDFEDMLVRADFRAASLSVPVGGASDVTAVPLPAAVWLFLSGLAGVAGFARNSVTRR